MSASQNTARQFSSAFGDLLKDSKVKSFGAPIVVLLVLAMMILPLPPFALDLLFTFNIAISLMVLLVAMNTKSPLEFASFPIVLLVTTLLRLSLNVASTRVVLINGHEGPDAAGKVIEAFGEFLVGGNLAVGIVVFAILVVINFVVITKGAGRIAEVSARFALDAMPGKQMAIDADLNSGLIGEDEARERRQTISEESEFYGSMDGASKFVRGDAIAGILILLINIIGGLIIGTVQHDLSFSEAGEAYVLLAIGDGLVAQIPALVISIAAGLVVARVGKGKDIGSQLAGQIGLSSQPYFIVAAILTLLGLIPGMPSLAFLSLALLSAALGYFRLKDQSQAASLGSKGTTGQEDTPADMLSQAFGQGQDIEPTWEDTQIVEPLVLELGYRLVALAEKKQNGTLENRIKEMRRKFTSDFGFLCPPVHIKDRLEMKPETYRILVKGTIQGEADVVPDQLMAINPGSRAIDPLTGVPTAEPVYQLPAVWIEPKLKDHAKKLGYTVVEPSSVITTHLGFICNKFAATLLTREQVQGLLDNFSKINKKMVEDLVPKVMSLSLFQKVLQGLLAEGVHIRDLRTIMETLIEWGGKTEDADELIGLVRIALGEAIVQSLAGTSETLAVLMLDPDIESIVAQTVATNAKKQSYGIDPGLAETICRECAQFSADIEATGQIPVLLVSDMIRTPLSKMLKKKVPALSIVSHSEVPESRQIHILAIVGQNASPH